jgi:Tol biopolymer transport system component
MTEDRSLERAARSWLEAGPTQAPDHAVEATLLRIETLPQERDLRIPWRLPSMSTPSRVVAAAVIGAIAIGGVFLYLDRSSQPAFGAPGPGASPTPAISASAAAATATTSRARDYTGLPGWIIFEHFGQAPDGSTTKMDTDRRQIWLIHADGTGLHELAPGVPADGKTAPDVSPDGKKVAFSAWDHKIQLWEVGIDGSDPHVLASDCSGDPDVCLEGEPSYSPDGTRLAFVREVAGTPRQNVIGIRDLASGRVTLLETTRTPVTTGFHSQPSWSPDGRQLVFSLVSTDTKTDAAIDSRIFIANADGTGLHDMGLPTGTPWGDPDWSPDGSRIVFSSWPIRDFNKDSVSVYSARPDGSDLTMLTEVLCGGCGAPSWTSDGRHILFWGPTTFWLMDPDGKNPAPINDAKLTFFGDTLGYGYYGLLQPTP